MIGTHIWINSVIDINAYEMINRVGHKNCRRRKVLFFLLPRRWMVASQALPVVASSIQNLPLFPRAPGIWGWGGVAGHGCRRALSCLDVHGGGKERQKPRQCRLFMCGPWTSTDPVFRLFLATGHEDGTPKPDTELLSPETHVIKLHLLQKTLSFANSPVAFCLMYPHMIIRGHLMMARFILWDLPSISNNRRYHLIAMVSS